MTEEKKLKIESFSHTGPFYFLSNFYPIILEIDGKKYRSSEHYYQACKALNMDEHEKIRNTLTPNDSKKMARTIKSFDPNWDTNRLTVMRKVLEVKFAIPEMREALLATDGFELIEGNYWGDDFWGVCTSEGQNNLGKILMELREKYKRWV